MEKQRGEGKVGLVTLQGIRRKAFCQECGGYRMAVEIDVHPGTVIRVCRACTEISVVTGAL